MSGLRQAIDLFEANSRARIQAEHQAGQVWVDTVLRRLTDRKLTPLADEERRFRQALVGFDYGIDAALSDLDNY